MHGWEYSLVYPRALVLVDYYLIFVCDIVMFLPKGSNANYAGDNTPYSTFENIDNIIIDLEQAPNILSKWFIDKYIKTNPDKYLVLFSEICLNPRQQL